MTVSRLNFWWCAFCAVAVTLIGGICLPALARADFGLVPGSFRAVANNKDGTITSQASSHPYSYTVSFQLKTESNGHTEGGRLRDVIADLPPGLIGNPQAVPRCPRQLFDGDTPQCPFSTQIGILRADIPGLGGAFGPVYNMVPPPGTAAEIGFSIVGENALSYASLRSETDYGISVLSPSIPIEVSSVTVEIWGVPADPSHNAERGRGLPGEPAHSSDAPLQPFLTLPANCEAPLETKIAVDSDQAPGVFDRQSAFSLDPGGDPAALAGCESVPFSPSILAAPSTASADSASGLGFELKLPNQGLLSPGGIAETEPEKTEVTLPQGVTVNPSAANGLGACTPAQFKAVTVASGPGQDCPESSKVGMLVAKTPLLEEAIEGSVYLAAPHDNPFDSLIALYIVAKAPERGVLIKQAGEVRLDPGTGQLRATFAGLPPLPYSSFGLHFNEGPRGPLITPETCGTYTTRARLYPFSDPNSPVQRSAPFSISSGANSTGCVSSEAQEPNKPGFHAGATSPVAGSYSPFVLKLTREDGSQRLGALNVTLPPGMIGKLAGVQECSDAQLAMAAGRTGFGAGAVEQANPSCPQSSALGTVTAGAGAGSPLYVGGQAYLAGPYEGGPLSLAIVTPAVAGPFDLGNVVVRAALYINPTTAQVTVKSDPIPTMLQGIPLDIRSVAVSINRPEFTLNPTSCEPMSVTGEAITTQNQLASLSDRFQVGGCQGLPFKPSFTASTQGKTSKANGASLTVKVSQKPGEANIHKVALTLPLVLPARLTTLQKACTEAQFAINPAGCPAGSFIGTAKAITPILNVPLTGPAILVSHGGAAFPDVVFLLQGNERGGTIRIDLDGKTDIKKGITHSRFETVPDAPISSFETNLPQGPHSVLSANANLCTTKLSIPTELTGQNGATLNQSTRPTVIGCPKTKTLTRAQKLALALKACHKKPKGAKRKACERQARKKYGPVVKKAKKAKKRG
jgi:hypothetical protein